MGQVALDAPEPDDPLEPARYVPNPAEVALIAALRSGEFKQGVRRLRRQHNGDRFCCLGVACELYRREFKQGEWMKEADILFGQIEVFKLGDRHGEASVLPPAVRDWLGWSKPSGAISEDDCLAQRNDEGATFSEIADLIEQGRVERA